MTTVHTQLDQRVVLITGGGTGIGRAIAYRLADAGARVVITGRREEPLRQAVAERPETSPISWQTCDVGDLAGVQQVAQWTQQTHGPISILVNAAGVNIKTRSMEQMAPEQWEQVMRINATGAYHCMYAVLPQMKTQKDGLIVNISSISGKRALALGGIAYCASKFAMTALGTAVGAEVAEHGIRVTNVYPGEVDTPILQQRPQPVSEDHRQWILQPDDVAHLVLAVCQLPQRAHVPEVIIKPLWQPYV